MPASASSPAPTAAPRRRRRRLSATRPTGKSRCSSRPGMTPVQRAARGDARCRACARAHGKPQLWIDPGRQDRRSGRAERRSDSGHQQHHQNRSRDEGGQMGVNNSQAGYLRKTSVAVRRENRQRAAGQRRRADRAADAATRRTSSARCSARGTRFRIRWAAASAVTRSWRPRRKRQRRRRQHRDGSRHPAGDARSDSSAARRRMRGG